MSDVNVDFNITGEWLENLKAANSGLKEAVKNVENLSEAEKKNLEVMAKNVNLNKQAGEGYKAREKQVEVADRLAASFQKVNKSINGDQIVKAMNKISSAGEGTLNTFQEIEAEAVKLQQAILDSSGDIEEQARLIQNFASKLSPEDQVNFFAGAADAIEEVNNEMVQLDNTAKKPRQRLKELKDALSQLDETDPGFKEMALEAADLEDKIGDVRARITNLAADGKNLNGVISAVEGLTGAFAVGQGAIALFGDESEDLQKSLLKVQAVMAVLNGLQAIQNTVLEESAAKSLVYANAQKLVAFATGGATAASNAFRIALLATGIGAIIVAIGALVAYGDDLKEMFSDVSVEAREMAKATEAAGEASRDAAEQFDLEARRLRAIGTAEKEIIKQRIIRVKAAIEGTKQELQSRKELERQTLIERAKMRDLEKEGAAGKLANAVFGMSDEEFDQIKSKNKELSDSIKEYSVQVLELEKQLTDIEKSEADERNKNREDELKSIQAFTDEQAKLVNDFYTRLIELQDSYDQKRLDAASDEDQILAKAALNDELISLQEQELKAELDNLNLSAEQRLAAEEGINAAILGLREENVRETNRKLAELRKEEAEKQREEFLNQLTKEEELIRLKAEKEINSKVNEYNSIEAFEREKARKLLQLDIDLANERLKILKEQGDKANETQVAELETTIGNMQIQLDGLQPKKNESFLQQLFGIDDESLADTKQVLAGVIQDSVALINQVTQARIEASQAIIDQLNTQISEQEKAVEREKELQKDGLANSVESSQNALQELKKQRRDAIEEQEKLRRRQAVIEGLSQASALVTSATQMFASQAPKGLVGVALAIGAISTIFAYIQKVKKDASQTAIKARRGLVGDNLKLITGRSHEQGGERLLDHVEVEGDEMVGVLSRGATRKYRNEFTDMVMSMNNGRYNKEFNSAALSLSRDPEFKDAVKIEQELRIASQMQASEIATLRGELSSINRKFDAVMSEIQNWPKTYTDEDGNTVTKLGTKKITRKKK